MSIEYHTTCVEPVRRFEYWKEVVCQHCIPADSSYSCRDDFRGELRIKELGQVDLCTLRAPMHHWERTEKHVRYQFDDDLWLGVMERSCGRLEQQGRQVELRPGNLVLYDANQAFKFELGGGASHLIRFPRLLLERRMPGIANLTAIVLDDRRPGIIPLREMVLQAVSHPASTCNENIANRFSETLVDLLLFGLELQDFSGVNREKDLYSHAKRHIRDNLSDPALCVDSLAQALNVSRRTLTRAFALYQKTPSAAIWEERLASSRVAIEQGRVDSVSQVALEHGFSSFSHFSHAFRRAFGVSPRALLNQRRGTVWVSRKP